MVNLLTLPKVKSVTPVLRPLFISLPISTWERTVLVSFHILLTDSQEGRVNTQSNWQETTTPGIITLAAEVKQGTDSCALDRPGLRCKGTFRISTPGDELLEPHAVQS